MIASPVPRESLLHVVKVLPAAPQILAHLGRMLLDMNAGLSDVTDLLRRDAGLTARIIRVANSSAYNQGTPAGSIVDALARVGFKEVYRLTGFAALAQVSDQKLGLYHLSGAGLRENSLLTALVMEDAAVAASVDPRAAYTAGLLRSTGKIALDRLFARNTAGYTSDDGADLAAWETQFAGMHNCATAAIILKEWNFPEDLTAAIRDHYLLEPGADKLAHLLNLAAGEAHRAGHGLPGEAGFWDATPERHATGGISPAELAKATARARTKFEVLRAVVG